MNVENMLKVADYIENAPKEQFHMGAWFGNYFEDTVQECDTDTNEIIEYDSRDYWEDSPCNEMFDIQNFTRDAFPKQLNCGTTACIAGWAATTFYYEDRKKYDEFLEMCDTDYNSHSVGNFATEYLGLNDQEATNLFFCGVESIWTQVKEEYKFEFLPMINESWNIDNKHAADVLRRIANGELKLNGYNNINDEQNEWLVIPPNGNED